MRTALVALVVGVVGAATAHADPVVDHNNDRLLDDRLDFGPSLFRGATLERGEIEVSAPFLAVHYGFTERTTIGAQLWGLPFTGNGGGGLIASIDHHVDRGRWRFGGGALGGKLLAMVDGSGFQLQILLARASAEYRLGRRHAVNAQLVAGGATGLLAGDDLYSGVHVRGALAMVGYSVSPWRWLGFEIAGGMWPVGQANADSVAGRMSSGEWVSAKDMVVARGAVHIQTGRIRTSLGVVYLPAFTSPFMELIAGSASRIPIPILDVAGRW